MINGSHILIFLSMGCAVIIIIVKQFPQLVGLSLPSLSLSGLIVTIIIGLLLPVSFDLSGYCAFAWKDLVFLWWRKRRDLIPCLPHFIITFLYDCLRHVSMCAYLSSIFIIASCYQSAISGEGISYSQEHRTALPVSRYNLHPVFNSWWPNPKTHLNLTRALTATTVLPQIIPSQLKLLN